MSDETAAAAEAKNRDSRREYDKKRWLHQRMSGGTKLPTGRRFGILTVARFVPGTGYYCQCECGNLVAVRRVQLETGSVTSCGRCRPDGFQPPLVETPEPRKKVASLPAGRQFGHLTTTEVVTSRGYYCRCECGNLVVVRRFQLENGSAASCGRCRPAHFQPPLAKPPDPEAKARRNQEWLASQAAKREQAQAKVREKATTAEEAKAQRRADCLSRELATAKARVERLTHEAAETDDWRIGYLLAGAGSRSNGSWVNWPMLDLNVCGILTLDIAARHHVRRVRRGEIGQLVVVVGRKGGDKVSQPIEGAEAGLRGNKG